MKNRINLMFWIQFYLVLILLLYIYGPVKWQTENPITTIFIIVINQIFFYLGYFYATRKKKKIGVSKFNDIDYFLERFAIILIVSMTVNFMYLIRIMKIMGYENLFSLLITAISNPKQLYQLIYSSSFSSSQMWGGKFLAILIALTGPITIGVIPVSIVTFKSQKFNLKMLSIANFLVYVFLMISTGKNEGVFTIGLLVFSAFLIMGKKGSVKKTSKYKKYIVLVSISAILLSGYNSMMLNRNQGSYSLPLGNNVVQPELSFTKYLPKTLEPLIVYLDIYLTQGYYGMSLATTVPWKPTFGLGHSYYIRENVDQFIDGLILERSYQARVEDFNWKKNANWHSVYTWFANDVSFVFVPLIMFIMGKILFDSYYNAVTYRNPIAITLLSLLIIFAFFIPANNKLFASSETFFAFWLLVTLFYFPKRIKLR